MGTTSQKTVCGVKSYVEIVVRVQVRESMLYCLEETKYNVLLTMKDNSDRSNACFCSPNLNGNVLI